MMTPRMYPPSRSGSNQDAQQLHTEVALVAEAGKGLLHVPSGIPEGKTATMTVEWSKAEPPPQEDRLASFERVVLPHLDAAYNLARWLTHNDADAEDQVQEAYLRALESIDGFRGGNARAWLLTIVRNTCYTWLRQNRSNELTAVFDEEIHSVESAPSDPEKVLLQAADNQLLRQALEELPLESREVVILREVEGASYKEIADIAGIPVGTVMSRLARARKQLQRRLAEGMRRIGKYPALVAPRPSN
jgi:RNA polymerase sigma factor (sigma-70 family)